MQVCSTHRYPSNITSEDDASDFKAGLSDSAHLQRARAAYVEDVIEIDLDGPDIPSEGSEDSEKDSDEESSRDEEPPEKAAKKNPPARKKKGEPVAEVYDSEASSSEEEASEDEDQHPSARTKKAPANTGSFYYKPLYTLIYH